MNVNVPNLPIDEMKGWRHTEVGTLPPRAMATADLDPIAGHEDAYVVRMSWGDEIPLPEGTDGGTIERDEVSVTYLSRILPEPRDDMGGADTALDGLFGR
jgi:5'-nucleotidase